jgi:tRNA 5-methylaminomethyl-2-thiouridine biosynthesis bifunctional protein
MPRREDRILTLKPASLQWAEDGSVQSAEYGDVYFQRKQGREESYYVFIEANKLPERFPACQNVAIAELGFGTGLNFLLTAKLFLETAPAKARLFFCSVEKNPILKSDLARIYAPWPDLAPLTAPLLDKYPFLTGGFHHLHLAGGRVHLMLCLGDVTEMLPQISGGFDAWYLDGFTPAKNPAMWTENLFPQIAARTNPGGTLATFSVAGHMRRALKTEGFDVKKIDGFGIKWSMTTARKKDVPQAFAHKKIIVLGAGIAGCSAAYSLAQRGHQVTLIDRQESFAEETSGNPVAVVYPKLTADPSPMGAFHAAGFCYTRNLLRALKVSTWQESGVLHLDHDEEAGKRHRNMVRKNDWPADFARYSGGLLHEGGGTVSPRDFCSALINHPNIERKFSCAVDTVPGDADAVVIALGHDSKDFKQTAWLPLQSLRGQITLLTATEPSKSIAQVLCHDGYITPAINGVHSIGATFDKEEPGDYSLREEDHLENLKKLNHALPGLGFTAENIAGGRTGYRTTTPDKLPLIGPCPDYDDFINTFAPLRQGTEMPDVRGKYHDNVFITTAFGAHGMTGAPLAGEIVAAMISGDPLPVPHDLIEYLIPERFILRDLRRRKI